MKNEKRAPTPPWRKGGLLSLSRFISYCAERGVRVKKEQLEFYDRMNLLTPAVIVFHPIGRLMKVKNEQGADVFVEHDGKPQIPIYYYSGGVGFHGESHSYRFFGRYAQRVEDDSLKHYDYFFPSLRKYAPWSAYTAGSHDFVPDLSALGTPAEIYYSPEQIFPLIDIQDRYTLSIKGASLFKEAENWVKLGKECERVFSPEAKFLQPHIEKVYKAIKLFFLTDKLWFELIRDKAEEFGKNSGEYRDGEWRSNELTAKDFEAMLALWEKDDKKKAVEKILKSEKVTSTELRRLAEVFIYKGFFADPNIEIFEFYRATVPVHLVQKQKGAARLCEDYYRIAQRLLWALSAFEKEMVTLDEYYRTRSHRFTDSCLICGKGFRPSKNGGKLQRTCANPECVRRNKNANRSKKRKENKARSGT